VSPPLAVANSGVPNGLVRGIARHPGLAAAIGAKPGGRARAAGSGARTTGGKTGRRIIRGAPESILGSGR
jgi:hypothetical protein